MNSIPNGITVNDVTFFIGNNGLPEKIILPEELDHNDLLASPGSWNIFDENDRSFLHFSVKIK